MNCIETIPSDFQQVKMLLEQVSVEKRNEFKEYVEYLCTHDDCYGIDMSFLGFMEDYSHISSILNSKIRTQSTDSPVRIVVPAFNYVVFDIGCATALQHVFFSKCEKYIGIDFYIPDPKFFNPNCEFKRGKFSELVKNGLKIPVNAFGIANMSLLYAHDNEEDIEMFNSLFHQKFII